jgi:hypothetical protein
MVTLASAGTQIVSSPLLSWLGSCDVVDVGGVAGAVEGVAGVAGVAGAVEGAAGLLPAAGGFTAGVGVMGMEGSSTGVPGAA